MKTAGFLGTWLLFLLASTAALGAEPYYRGSLLPFPASLEPNAAPLPPSTLGRRLAIESPLSLVYLRRALDDVGHIATAPARWERAAWLHAGVVAGALSGTVALLDEPVRDVLDGSTETRGSWREIERLGERKFTMPLLLSCFVAGRAADDSRAEMTALDGMIAVIIANGLITSKLKHVFGRGRPYLERGAEEWDSFHGGEDYRSFPSGHGTEAFTIAAVLATHYVDSPWVGRIAYGLAGAVGLSRMKRDQHWLSDVLAGAVVGIGVGRSVASHNREQRSTGASVSFLPVTGGALLLVEWQWDGKD